MLRTHTGPYIRLTIDPIPYLHVSGQHPLAVDTLRIIPGQSYKLDDEGIPVIGDRIKIDKKTERQAEVAKYAARIYSLNEPWQRLISDRDAFNHELLRFPHHGYKRRYLVDQTESNLIRTKENPAAKEVDKTEGEKVDLSTLGSAMDKGPEAQARRAQQMKASREWHNYLRMEPYLNILGTFALFIPDYGYSLSILGAYGNGIKHPDHSVRESTITILQALTQGTLLKLNTDIDQLGPNPTPAMKSMYAKEALGVLNGILRLLYSPHYGMHDSVQSVQNMATNLDSGIIDAIIPIKALVIDTPEEPKLLI